LVPNRRSDEQVIAEPNTVAALLRERGLRVTPQRRAIFAAFEGGRAGHPSADEVYRRARSQLPELSRGTVYNTLNEFVSAGLLTVVSIGRVQLYDANTADHHHFRCRSCNRLYDVHPIGANKISLTDDFFMVEQTTVLLDGFCGECASPSAA